MLIPVIKIRWSRNVQLSYRDNGNYFTGKTAYFYLDDPIVLSRVFLNFICIFSVESEINCEELSGSMITQGTCCSKATVVYVLTSGEIIYITIIHVHTWFCHHIYIGWWQNRSLCFQFFYVLLYFSVRGVSIVLVEKIIFLLGFEYFRAGSGWKQLRNRCKEKVAENHFRIQQIYSKNWIYNAPKHLKYVKSCLCNCTIQHYQIDYAFDWILSR